MVCFLHGLYYGIMQDASCNVEIENKVVTKVMNGTRLNVDTVSEVLLNNLNIAVICLDAKLAIILINQSAEMLLEVSGKRAKDHHIKDLLLNSDELCASLQEALSNGQPYTRRKVKLDLIIGHTITCDYAITPLEHPPRLLLELYPLDRYLKIDREESITAQNEVTRQMIRGLAHEIKNPLGGIKGSAQLLEKELNSADLKPYTDIIIDETDRLTSLVNRLLGPISLPQPASVNIHEILERVRKLIELESNPPIKVIRDYDPSIPDLYIDKELMVQVFLNIARNAMQSLEQTNEPRLQFTSRIERQFTIGHQKHRLVIKVDIIDNGPGIPDGLKEHLFYPMISGRPDGTGLGLSFAQAIIHQHKGLIEVESHPGETSFSVITPLETLK
ncbi:MAG: two-component system nitrogen regulation sensor histidine kinase GlnL [Flavobacterium sp.]|jgi:two-component system nitrogen regulation sensor histidine kinase GlnL